MYYQPRKKLIEPSMLIFYTIKMYIWFFICVLCMFIAISLHFESVKHVKLQEEYGKERGVKIGKLYGAISGTMEFISLIGLWISPQPRFAIPIFSNLSILIVNFSTPIFHLMISLPLIILGAWISIRGVKATRLEVAETHCTPMELETTGVYSTVRHPQYFGWILVHFGMSILLSVWYSMLFTPVLIALIYLIARIEEEELISEFGEEYADYQKKVPMLIPNFPKKIINDKSTESQPTSYPSGNELLTNKLRVAPIKKIM